MLTALALTSACKSRNPLFCRADVDCADPLRPVCDVNGSLPGSDGLTNTCVPDPAGADAGPSSDAMICEMCAYQYTRTLTPADSDGFDNFGFAVAASGPTVLVGAVLNSDDGSASGSAYVFDNDGTSWNETIKLTASDAAAGDRFGRAVGLDGTVAAVGAARDDNKNGTEAGAVYVFELVGDTWEETARLVAATGSASDRFGTSVAVSGTTIAIGVPFDDTVAPDAGAVYVFEKRAGSWEQRVRLTASDGGLDHQLGTTVAISGGTIVAGALFSSDSGSAYVFENNADAWEEAQRLDPSDGASSDRFGAAVGISGDAIAVGAYRDDDDGDESGAVYVFTRSGMFSETDKLTASDAQPGDRLGFSVSVSGQVIAAGATGDDEAMGSAYVFEGAGAGKLTPPDGSAGDHHGSAISVSNATLAVGAPDHAGPGGPGSGAVYIYEQMPE